MKTRIATLSLIAVMASSSAFAGGMDEPMMEEPVMAPVVVEEESGSADAWAGWLLLLALVAAVAAS